MGKVSICIPTYNNVSDVRRLLDSIRRQDYKDIEINLSDDSTNTEIEVLVKKYLKYFEEEQIDFRYTHNKKPLGHIFNWNAAIDMATGDYIKIMFSDDWFTSDDSLSCFVDLLESNPSADFVFSGSRQVLLAEVNPENMKRQVDALVESEYDRCATEEFIEALQKDYRHLFISNQVGAPSAVMYRRNKIPVYFDEKSNWASDVFLYFEILERNSCFVYTNKPLISIGMHGNQYTESFKSRDMRIYNDYRYMYTKYQLQKSEECKAHFLNNFIVKYNRNLQEARSLEISIGAFVVAYWNETKETVKCFVKSRMKH